MIINVERRSGDFMAFLNGDRRLWESGRTEQEAIGKLIISHAAGLGVQLVLPPVEEPMPDPDKPHPYVNASGADLCIICGRRESAALHQCKEARG